MTAVFLCFLMLWRVRAHVPPAPANSDFYPGGTAIEAGWKSAEPPRSLCPPALPWERSRRGGRHECFQSRVSRSLGRPSARSGIGRRAAASTGVGRAASSGPSGVMRGAAPLRRFWPNAFLVSGKRVGCFYGE